MEKFLYALYDTPDKADESCLELLNGGLEIADAVVVTREAYKDPALDFDENFFELPMPIMLFSEPSARTEPIDIPVEETIPKRTDPFGDIPGSMWLLENLAYPGNLMSSLRELGFGREAARNIESSILDGGAMLVLRLAPGRRHDPNGLRTIERLGGTLISPRQRNPYVG